MLATKDWILENYKSFNDKYFQGILPKITPRLSKAKTYLGWAHADFDHANKSTNNYVITISNYYDQPEENFVSTLLHEMIHIKDYFVNGKEYYRKAFFGQKYNIGHGEFFLKEAERIKNESGVDVEVRASAETMSKADFSEDTKKKLETPYYVLASNTYYKDQHCAVRLPKNFDIWTIKNIMRKYALENCVVINGVFELFKGKRGGTARILSEDRYNRLVDSATSKSETIDTLDSYTVVLEKINNRK